MRELADYGAKLNGTSNEWRDQTQWESKAGARPKGLEIAPTPADLEKTNNFSCGPLQIG
jgi:hypothetical protein